MVSRLEWWETYVGGKEVVKATQSILPKSIMTGSHMLHISLPICDPLSAAFADGASHNDIFKKGEAFMLIKFKQHLSWVIAIQVAYVITTATLNHSEIELSLNHPLTSKYSLNHNHVSNPK